MVWYGVDYLIQIPSDNFPNYQRADASVTDTGATGYALAIRGNAVAYAGSYYENLGQMCFSPPTPAVCVTETVGASFMWNAFTPVRRE